jgi:SAM-dependent methyltransferase
MAFGWIDPQEFSINCILLMDPFILRVIAKNRDPQFRKNLAVVLANHESIRWYFLQECPEFQSDLIQLADQGRALDGPNAVDAERYVLDALDWAVVYMYPLVMEKLPYIAQWDAERLLSLTDFRGKGVLDIGSGTGRLAFAAASLARTVYACEPAARLRAHLRKKRLQLGFSHVQIVDGLINDLPFPDDSFDVVMGGHVIGDDYDAEYREMFRVARPGAMLIDCPGEDDRKRPEGPRPEMLALGFKHCHYVSKTGGDVYRYWKVLPRN